MRLFVMPFQGLKFMYITHTQDVDPNIGTRIDVYGRFMYNRMTYPDMIFL